MASSRSSDLTGYSVLRDRVRETLIWGQRQIDAFKVQTYWQAGSYINEHVRLNGGRAEYGQQVLLKLGRDLDLDESVLDRAAKFAEKFPDFAIPATWQELPASPRQIEKNGPRNLLSWSHYRILITVEDDRQRYRLAEKAERGGWTVERLEQAVWELKSGSKSKALPPAKGAGRHRLLTPQLGQLHTYRLIQSSQIHWLAKISTLQKHHPGKWAGEPATGGLLLDHGFKNYRYLEPGKVRGFGAEEIVEVKEGRLVKSKRTTRDLFIPAEGADIRHPEAFRLENLVFVNHLLLEQGHAVLMRA